MFWTLAEFCAEFKLPFDLMIGVNRAVYRDGVYQGQDLYDSRVSLIQYQELFNAFPQVMFPISVLASVTNQELVSYAWIFPNVVTNGHWWYSNTPAYIEHDAAARLEAVPQTKQIGYYSDAYKLEFCLPKFGMYKRILAKTARRAVRHRTRLERTTSRRFRPPRPPRQRRANLQPAVMNSLRDGQPSALPGVIHHVAPTTQHKPPAEPRAASRTVSSPRIVTSCPIQTDHARCNRRVRQDRTRLRRTQHSS